MVFYALHGRFSAELPDRLCVAVPPHIIGKKTTMCTFMGSPIIAYSLDILLFLYDGTNLAVVYNFNSLINYNQRR